MRIESIHGEEVLVSEAVIFHHLRFDDWQSEVVDDFEVCSDEIWRLASCLCGACIKNARERNKGNSMIVNGYYSSLSV